MKFKVLEAIMWFDEERSNALERMLPLELPHKLMKSREYYLEAYLEQPPFFPVSTEGRNRIARKLLQRPIAYSSKRAERAIASLITKS